MPDAFTKINLNLKSYSGKITPTSLDIVENSKTCTYDNNKNSRNCILFETKANSCICDNGINSCLAVRYGYDICDQILKLQEIGFFDPADYIQEALLIKLVNKTKVK
jgi:hypothetical protein